MSQAKPMAKRLEGEPEQDYIKFLTFLGLGSNRSMNKAFQQYYETTNDVSRTWVVLAEQYRWVERASEYDKRA